MSGICSNNCILIGDLESFCLACSIHLPGEKDVLDHLRSPKHATNLEPVAYFEKFKEDFIKKVNGVYFCEVCNMMFSTAAKVGIHVTEDTHAKGRRRQLKRVGSSIVLQKDTLIEERAWHGLVDDTCVLCNIEFEDYSTHISEQRHVLNVVANTVIIDKDNNIYRKVDGSYQCLTCNKVLSDTLITKHLNSAQHKSAIIKYDTTQKDINDTKQKNQEEKVNTKEKDTNKYTKEKNERCNVIETIPDKSSTTDEKSLDTNPVPEKIVKKTNITEELETFAKQHGFLVDKETNALYCKICTSVVPASKSNIIEHIAGKKHKDKTKQTITLNIEKVVAKDYFRQTLVVETRFGRFSIINDTFCVEFDHFFGLSNDGKISCEFCRMDLTPENVVMHLISPFHAHIVRNSSVITSLQDEFVRQINSVYQCGFCGRVEKDFDAMLRHLDTIEHKQEKAGKQLIFQRIKYDNLLNSTPNDIKSNEFVSKILGNM